MHCVVVLQQMLRRYTHVQLYYRQGCRRRRREEDVCSVLFYLQLLLLHLLRRSTPATSPRSAFCIEVLRSLLSPPPPGPLSTGSSQLKESLWTQAQGQGMRGPGMGTLARCVQPIHDDNRTT